MIRFARRAALAAAFLAFAAQPFATAPASAQTFPSRNVTLVVPFAAGGPTDVVARIVAEHMSRTLGRPVIVENVAGAGGTTGAGRVAQAQADGHTILVGHTGTQAASVALYPQLRYNPVTDFAHIGLINTNSIYVVAKNALPANNLQEFLTWLRANQRTANSAHAGIGSVSHTTCLLFNAAVGVNPQSVPYRGTGPAMNDLVAGQVDYMCDQVVNVAPQIRANTIKAFAVAQPERNQALPNVPTAREGGLPQFDVVVWNAMFAPKGTPAPVVARLNEALRAALADAPTRARLVELGADIAPDALLAPEGLQRFVEAEVAKWTPIIRAAGVVGTN